jgi:hypothetical protein
MIAQGHLLRRLSRVLLACLPVWQSWMTVHANAVPGQEMAYSAYADAYFAHDFNHLPTRYRPYTTQPYYSDEPALNLGFIDAKVDTQRYYGRLAIQYGSSVVANYAEESREFFRYFQEAYFGVKLSERITIDTGIFFSHIGMESWISRDDWNLTRSLIAENSPYYQSGLRMSYRISDSLAAQALLLRGWQNISNDEAPALGTQIAWNASERTSLVHNLFVGNIHGERIFNDFIVKQEITDSFGIAAAYDLGVQKRRAEDTAIWQGWSVIPHYKMTNRLSIAGRVEYYSDPHQVIVTSLSGERFNATGLSANIDYAITPKLLWRNEYRAMLSTQQIFPRHEGFSQSDTVLTSSVAYTLD